MMRVCVSLLLCILLMSRCLLTFVIKDDNYANVIVTNSCIDKERKALLDFKSDLLEINILYNWGSEDEKMDCCQWVGVRCDNKTGNVIELDLSTFSSLLGGKISPSLQQLHQLQYLNLNGIDFQSKPLPNFFGSLTNLRSLDISGANLSGPIPHQLGTLSNLLRLDLSRNFLEGSIPLQVANLSSLLHLNLGSNFLNGSIPTSLGDSTFITHLDLSENHLEGVIPKSFGNSSSLVELNLSGNLLNGLLPSFAGCSLMKDLILHSNALHGDVPNFTGCLSLCNLILADNSLNGSIPDFTRCALLQKLDLSGNLLSGNLPNSIGQLSNLLYLDVSSNSLQGVVSSDHFLNLTFLEYLDLSYNSFALESLRLSSALDTIKLQSCKLGTNFPLWIKDQAFLTHIDISNAGISDSIPPLIWKHLPSELKFLNLSSNDIKGMLPDIPTDFKNYHGLDLSNNRLEGRVPLMTSKLASLNLSGNKFSGNLSFLCQIDVFLRFLDLSNNLFSGRIPDCLLKFQDTLLILNLSNNNLSREIPSSFGFLTHLQALYLRSNAFVGEIPMSLSNCSKLRFVDLAENNLTGRIPAWIGERLTDLYVLVLRSNRFYGRLPSQVCWLYNLQLLDLSNNGFSGNIPRCFGNFTAMTRKGFRDDLTDHYYSSYGGTTFRSFGKPVYMNFSCMNYCPVVSDEKSLFIDNAWVSWKGARRSFGRSGLQLLKSIDISSNNLSGKLPYEITSLVELVSLNFSTNRLKGEIPNEMGRLKALESLDMSRNEFSGYIPLNLSQLNFLSYLDLSNNNLSGRIPTGPQLQRFNSSSYSGNRQLCGPPLTPRCGILLPPATVVGNEDGDGDEFWRSYYTGMGAGFAGGFCAICGVLLLNCHCRYFFFASLSHMKDWIYVIVAVHFRKHQRKV